MTEWEIHETVTCELHIRRVHTSDQVPMGRIMTYGIRRSSRALGGHDVVAIIMPQYIRRRAREHLYGSAAESEDECDAVPNWDLANAVLESVKV